MTAPEAEEAYVPEPWDVVRSDGVVVVHGKGISEADTACYYLNTAKVERRGVGYRGSYYTYEVHSSSSFPEEARS